MDIILLDVLHYEKLKHVLYNIHHDGKLVGVYGYKVGGPLPLQNYDLEYANATAIDRCTQTESPPSGPSQQTRLALASMSILAGRRNVALPSKDYYSPFENPKLDAGHRESACNVPNIGGQEIVVVAKDMVKGESVAQTPVVRTLTCMMAHNRCSNLEYECSSMFAEVTTTALHQVA